MGRGRGRLDPAELEMPLEKFQMVVLQSPPSTGPIVSGFAAKCHSGEFTSPPSPHPPDDLARSVACVGSTVKISIPNTGEKFKFCLVNFAITDIIFMINSSFIQKATEKFSMNLLD